MHKRGEVYRQFIERFPDAKSITVRHENGRESEIAAGIIQGVVEEMFVGTYKTDGEMVHESRIQEDMLLAPQTLNDRDPVHPYSLGASRAISQADSPLASE